MRYCRQCGTETMVCVSDAISLGNTWELFMCNTCLTELEITKTTTDRGDTAEVNITEKWKMKKEYITRTEEQVRKIHIGELLDNDN